MTGATPRLRKLLGGAGGRGPRPRVEGDPRSDTAAAAAHMLGVLWATQSQGATVKELRAAIGLTREQLEAAYEYLQTYPLLGLAVERHGDELRLVSAGQVAASVERYLNTPQPVSLSTAAQQVLAIVAYRQLALDDHRLFVTTPAFLEYLGLRDLADLPPLPSLLEEENSANEPIDTED